MTIYWSAAVKELKYSLFPNFIYYFLISAQKEGGTQLKLIIEFDDGGHALFKPMR